MYGTAAKLLYVGGMSPRALSCFGNSLTSTNELPVIISHNVSMCLISGLVAYLITS